MVREGRNRGGLVVLGESGANERDGEAEENPAWRAVRVGGRESGMQTRDPS